MQSSSRDRRGRQAAVSSPKGACCSVMDLAASNSETNERGSLPSWGPRWGYRDDWLLSQPCPRQLAPQSIRTKWRMQIGPEQAASAAQSSHPGRESGYGVVGVGESDGRNMLGVGMGRCRGGGGGWGEAVPQATGFRIRGKGTE